MFCIPPRFVPQYCRAASFVYTLWVHWSPLPVGWGRLSLYEMLSAVCLWCLWTGQCTSASVSLYEKRAFLSCVRQQCQTFTREQPHRRHGDSAQHDMHTQHVDMITPQAAPCVLGWSLTTYLKTLSIGAKTTRSNITPSVLNSPPPIHLPFFSLINMEMSCSLLLVGKKAVMSLVTSSMDVFGLQGLLFSKSMSYLCLGSESKM